jgi:hypothetical protein
LGREVRYGVHDSAPLDFVPSRLNALYSLTVLLLKDILAASLSSHLRQGLSGGLFPSGFPTKYL